MGHDFQADIDSIASIPAIPTILDVVCRTTGMGFAAVARVTEGRWVACGVLDSIAFGLQPGGELKVETTICHEIREHRLPVVINHASQDDAYRGHPTPALYGFESYISMPITLPDGTFFGTLCAIDPKPRRLDTPEVVGMVRLFSELIAFHLDAHGKLAASKVDLQREREASDLREQFIAVLGHDLRNPLAAISGGISLIERKPERLPVIAGQLMRAVDRMSGLIDDVLDFARGRLGSGLTIAAKADALRPTLQQVIDELQVTSPDRTILADLDIAGPVTCDHARVAQLFSNLLGNAMTYGSPGEPIRVHAGIVGGMLELSVANGGEPIPPAALERLFQPFFRGAVRPSQQGLGLGLYIASEIARAHGGTLKAVSTPEETRFTFQMPLAAE